MPELPEVETVRSQLATVLKNKKINGLEIRKPKLIKSPIFSFKKNVVGAKVTGVKRRAKLIIINLSNSYSVFIHLKMTGQLVYRNKKILKVGGHPIKDGVKDLPNKYSHIIFSMTDGGELFFNDLRQFGYLKLVKTLDIDNIFVKSKIGPEPLDKEFSLDVFQKLLKKKPKSKIKPLLMDQTFVAGIGNIYAAEVCFSSKVDPRRLVNTLKEREIFDIYKHIVRILKLAVKKQGTSSKNYVDAYGNPGSYVPMLKVYGRKDKNCFQCKTKILSMKLAGRGTNYCPKCQK
ncbi:MAG: DNA-formamidopyrimidine glycosylase [Candidatus Kerfeldbacteria bacterium]|jgi:formamidopyrimidine-DNA glycosylase